MSKKRVIWSEGMFLRPQHFQQHDRYLENRIHARVSGLISHDWGFTRLKLSNELNKGKLVVLEASGIFQDGTPFNIPEEDEILLSLDIEPGIYDTTVVLALPTLRAQSSEIDTELSPETLARYRIQSEDIKDNIAGSNNNFEVQIGQLRPRLMLSDKELSGYHCLGVAQIKEVTNDKVIFLDEAYIPVIVKSAVSQQLKDWLQELKGLLTRRGDELSDNQTKANPENFVYLQTVNRYELVIEHILADLNIHPEDLYLLMLQMVGDFSVFDTSGSNKRRPSVTADYRHENLQISFQLQKALRGYLSTSGGSKVISVPLSVHQGVYHYSNSKEKLPLLDTGRYILAVKAHVDEGIILRDFASQTIIASGSMINEQIKGGTTAIDLKSLAIVPDELPRYENTCYFELLKSGPNWQYLGLCSMLLTNCFRVWS